MAKFPKVDILLKKLYLVFFYIFLDNNMLKFHAFAEFITNQISRTCKLSISLLWSSKNAYKYDTMGKTW